MRPIALAALIALGGCATQPVAVVGPVCGAIRTVWVSKDDVLTPDTASSIEANNLARAKLCGKSTPPPRDKGAPTS